MEVFKYFKQLYQGKDVLSNHITLFSLLGIMVILLNNAAAHWGSNILYFDFFAVAPSSDLELWLNIFFGILILIYMIGYGIKFIHKVIEENNIELPNFDLEPSSYFVKFLPVFLIWIFYYVATFLAGILFTFSDNNPVLVYVFSSIMICLIPFIHLIFVEYVRDFKITKNIIYPWNIFRYLDKNIGDVIFLVAAVIILSLIPDAVIFLMLKFAHGLASEVMKLSVYLAGLCIGLYLIFVLKLVYFAGLAKILNEKFVKSN